MMNTEKNWQRPERQAAFFCGVGLLCFIAGGFLFATRPAISQSDKNTFQTPFRIKNAQGKVIFEVDDNLAGGRLKIFDKGGQPFADLSIGEYSQGLAIFDLKDRPKPVAYLLSNRNGGVVLLQDHNGKTLFRRP